MKHERNLGECVQAFAVLAINTERVDTCAMQLNMKPIHGRGLAAAHPLSRLMGRLTRAAAFAARRQPAGATCQSAFRRLLGTCLSHPRRACVACRWHYEHVLSIPLTICMPPCVYNRDLIASMPLGRRFSYVRGANTHLCGCMTFSLFAE